MHLYIYIHATVLFVSWYDCKVPVFFRTLSCLSSLSIPLSLSFWGSGHVLLLVLQYSFMFTVPSVSEYSFCFSFLAVDDGEICVKRTGVSASLRIPPPLPRYPLHPPSSLYMHSPPFSSFPSVSFSLLFCGWSKHACPLCGLVLSDIASKVSKHGA